MIFDLHVHTTYSDGLLSPKQVIDLAIKNGLDGISITDHDTVSGIESAIEYSKNMHNFYIIPGIEFSCIHKNEEVHILGYFIDHKSSDIINLTQKLKEFRKLRGLKMIDRLKDLGVNLTEDKVKELSKQNNIGRPHIARALVKFGYANSIMDAFEKYLGVDKPGYVERYKLNIKDTLDLIHRVDGIAVIAHPGILENKKIINYCLELGIDGLEVIHSKHTKSHIEYLLQIANNHNLIVTGGSDCHGEIINGEYLLGKYYINISDIPTMKGRI